MRCSIETRRGDDGFLHAVIKVSRYLKGGKAGELDYMLVQEGAQIGLIVDRRGSFEAHPLLSKNPIQGMLVRECVVVSPNHS
jgi:hypothetical protein